MKMITIYFTTEELELIEDNLLTILTYNDQGRIPVKYNKKDTRLAEDIREGILEALKQERKVNDN